MGGCDERTCTFFNFSIGQGYLLVTPIQAVKMVATVANGGREVFPHLIKRKQEVVPQKILATRELEIIRSGMKKAVSSSSGTGCRAKVPGVDMFAKTGTAQVSGKQSHGWYVGFAEINDKKICYSVFLENGGSGGMKPAEIVRNLVTYLKDNDVN